METLKTWIYGHQDHPKHPPLTRKELWGWYVSSIVFDIYIFSYSESECNWYIMVFIPSPLIPTVLFFRFDIFFYRWWYDWSNSAVSSVIISGFLPLLVQDAAQKVRNKTIAS